jgi:hypothetical protein
VNLPWRENTPVDWEEVASDLKQKIEEKINTLADENQKKQLRFLLRLDTYALEENASFHPRAATSASYRFSRNSAGFQPVPGSQS